MKNNMKWGNCSGNSLFIAMEGDLVSLNFYNKKNYSEANKVIIFYNFYFNYLQGWQKTLKPQKTWNFKNFAMLSSKISIWLKKYII